MQIIVFDPTYDDVSRDRERFLKELRAEISIISNEFELRGTKISEGADFPVIVVIVAGLFFLGKPIHENLLRHWRTSSCANPARLVGRRGPRRRRGRHNICIFCWNGLRLSFPT